MIKMYSTHCPKCMVLGVKLRSKGIEYEEITDVDIMKEKGISFVPQLEVDGEIMEFRDAINWVNEQEVRE